MKKLTIIFIIVITTIFATSCMNHINNPDDNNNNDYTVKTSDIHFSDVKVPEMNNLTLNIVAGKVIADPVTDVAGEIKEYIAPEIASSLKSSVQDKIDLDNSLRDKIYVSDVTAGNVSADSRSVIFTAIIGGKNGNILEPSAKTMIIPITIEESVTDQDIFVSTYNITKDDVNIVKIEGTWFDTFEIIKGDTAGTELPTDSRDRNVYSTAQSISIALWKALDEKVNAGTAEKIRIEYQDGVEYKKNSIANNGRSATFIATFQANWAYEGEVEVEIKLTIKQGNPQDKFIVPVALQKSDIDIVVASPNENMTIAGQDISYTIPNTGAGKVSVDDYIDTIKNIYIEALTKPKNSDVNNNLELYAFFSVSVTPSREITILMRVEGKSPNYYGDESVDITITIGDATGGQIQDTWD